MHKADYTPLEFIFYITQVGVEPTTTFTDKIPDGEFITIKFNKDA